jgi:hypothetical protein
MDKGENHVPRKKEKRAEETYILDAMITSSAELLEENS